MTWLSKFGAVLAFLAVAAFASAPAVAQPGPFQSGVYAGPTIGYHYFANELDLGVSGFGSVINLDGLSMSGVRPGAIAGADMRIGDWVVGPFVEGSFGESEFSLSVAGAGDVVSASIGREIFAGVRIGRVFSSTLLYVAAYHAWADFDWQIGNAGLGFTLKGSEQLRGWGVALGAETIVWGHAALGVKAGFTDYDEVKYDLGGGANLSIDPDGLYGKATLTYRLENLFRQ